MTPPQATPRDIARNVSEDRGAMRLEITGLERRINHLQQKTNQHLIHLAVAIGLVALIAFAAVLMASQARAQCTDLDFNNDGVYPSDQDTTDFSNVLAGADCPTCDTIDFNGDGVFPDDRDFTDWLAVLAGGPCSNGGFTPVVCAGCVERTVGTPEFPTIAAAVLVSLDGGIITLPWRADAYIEAINWPGMDGLAYGGKPGRPLIVRGIPGPNGERPTLRLPATVGAGCRIVGGLQHVELRSLRLVGDNHGAIVAIQGDAKNILIEDCELVGGAIGISIQGMDRRTGSIRIRRNIIRDQRHPVSHSQGIFASADTMTLIDSNVFYNNGNRNQFCHGMYLVHTAGATRIVVSNWVLSPGSACIQARGGDFTIQSNVCWNFNTGIGTGHPMAYNATDEAKTVWTSATVSNNLLADAREGEPAQWGFSYMLGKPTAITGNIVQGVARPWMSSTDQGLRVPVGEVTRENNDVKTTSSGIDWQPIIATLLSRKSGEWGERFETGGVIDRSKR
jgi:hypothetical protein